MNSTERDLPEDKLRERLLGIVAGPNPALTSRQRVAIRDAADALASIRAERDAAVEALTEIACFSQTNKLLWWQVAARAALNPPARAIAGEQKNDA